MSLMNFVPESISLKVPLSIPATLGKNKVERMSTNVDSAGLQDVCNALGVNFPNHVGVIMGRVGTLKRHGEGWAMQPKPIPKSALSAWINGREKVPLWRLAQAVTILELIYLRVKHEANALNVPEDDPLRLHLKVAARWFAEFNKREELIRWLELLRRALYDRLKMDAGRSADAEKLYRIYANWRLEGLAKEGAANAEIQTPA